MNSNQVVTATINLQSVPKTHIKKADNGKLYFRAEIRRRKDVDKFGNNLNIIMPWQKDTPTVYFGNARLWNFEDATDADFNGVLEISVCLTDYPKERMKRVKDALYVDLEVRTRKEADKYGYTQSVIARQTKEEREAKAAIIYCGKGKVNFSVPKPATEQDLTDFDINNFIDQYQDIKEPTAAAAADTLPHSSGPSMEEFNDDLPF